MHRLVPVSGDSGFHREGTGILVALLGRYGVGVAVRIHIPCFRFVVELSTSPEGAPFHQSSSKDSMYMSALEALV